MIPQRSKAGIFAEKELPEERSRDPRHENKALTDRKPVWLHGTETEELGDLVFKILFKLIGSSGRDSMVGLPEKPNNLPYQGNRRLIIIIVHTAYNETTGYALVSTLPLC